MALNQSKPSNTASQLQWNDGHVEQRYKSLYLDTLGQAVNKHSSTAASPEGYLHGTLSTAGIVGAAPAVHSLKKQAAARLMAAAAAAQAGQVASATHLAAEPPAAADGERGADDDPGMRPRTLHPITVNRPDLQHTTADIDGAQPCPKNVFLHPRGTNPLNPEYQLPSEAPAQPLPSGPRDYRPAALLGDPLDVTDIAGARPRQRPASTRQHGGLDVSDIEGANAAWRPHHRQQIGVRPRDAGLDVSDINTATRLRPHSSSGSGGSSSSSKGHPGGPRAPRRVRPREQQALMDNSLRTMDIEGCRAVRGHAAEPHTRTTSAADIDGAAPADRDKQHLFARKKGAAAAAAAQQECAHALLSGLVLQPQHLAALWKQCAALDRDSSGCLTGVEVQAAMQSADLQLSSSDMQQLLSALKDNAGLLNYKHLTKRLNGRVSRPPSAPQQQQQQQPHERQQQAQQQWQPSQQQEANPQAPDSDSQQQHVQFAAPEASGAAAGGNRWLIQQQPPCSHVRPSSAPGRGRAAAAGGDGSAFKSISHWFAGSKRDTEATGLMSAWRPGHDVAAGAAAGPTAMQQASRCSTACLVRQQPQRSGCRVAGMPQQCQKAAGVDLLPAWLVGADPLSGTFAVVQPFGSCSCSAASSVGGAAAAACGGLSGAAAAGSAAAARPRPASAGPFARSDGSCASPAYTAAGAAEAAAAGKCRPTRMRPASACCPGRAAAGMCCDDDEGEVDTSQQQLRQPHRQQQQQQQPWSAVFGGSRHSCSIIQRPASAPLGARRKAGSGNKLRADTVGSSSPLSHTALTLGSAAAPVGWAERRRLQDSQLQDLLTVRLLE